MSTIAIVVCFIGALAAGFVAVTKNRNPFGWFLAGGLLPLISLMILATSSKLPPPEY